MHFSNKQIFGVKARRATALVLAVLLLCSVFVAGDILSVRASAVSRGDVVYVCIYDDDYKDWAFDMTAGGNHLYDLGVWAWKDGGGSRYYRLAYVQDRLYRFTAEEDFTNFKMIRTQIEPSVPGLDDIDYSTLDGVTSYSQINLGSESTSRITEVPEGMSNSFTVSSMNDTSYSAGSTNCFYFRENGSAWGYTPNMNKPAKGKLFGGNTDLEAEAAYYNAATGEYTECGVDLYPVNAKFYDYLTDFELQNGWRTNDDYEASRTYLHRMPYYTFNKYISDSINAGNGEWKYPLYFGNITSDWTSFEVFPYGTLVDKFVYPKNETNAAKYYGTEKTPPQYTRGHLRHENQISNYTGGERLDNFSIYANDSEAIASRTGSYSGSVMGLVNDTLTDGELYMKTTGSGLLSPYFAPSDSTNIVTTLFPMRVQGRSTTVDYYGRDVSVNYDTYEFNSRGKDMNTQADIAPDIVYFDYDDSTGRPTDIHYSNKTADEVKDAFLSLGGHSEGDHRGFFPFDNGGIGHDYGFGMRLDIDFNLSEDGYILGKSADGQYYKTDKPMKFEFAGDDDVWVFIDGKLALDLGGDHGNARGGITFAKDQCYSYITTGAVKLQDSPSYGSTEYASTVSTDGTATDTKKTFSLTGGYYNVFDSSDYKGTKYDTDKNHTLTVFYIERGLVESNLQLSFSFTPKGNDLSVDKEVDYSNVNPIVESRVERYFKTASHEEKFDFEVDDGSGNTSYSVVNNFGYHDEYLYDEDDDSANGYTFYSPRETSVTEFDIENQLKDDTDIVVTETVNTDCYYQYETTYTVEDEFMKRNNASNSTIDSGYVIVSDTDAASPGSTGGGSVTVPFKTRSTVDKLRKYNDFSVHALNTVKTADVEFKKSAESGSTDTDTFKFRVYIRLPHDVGYYDPTYNYFEDISEDDYDTEIDVKIGQTSAVLTDIPVGSQIKFVEQLTDAQKRIYRDIDKNTSALKDKGLDFTVTASGGTAEYVNTKLGDLSATVTAKKTLDGAPASQAFSFELTPVSGGTAQTARNDASGNISFSLTGLSVYSTYRYILTETAQTNTRYSYDSSRYLVEVTTNDTNATVKYYNTDASGTKGTEVTAGVVFSNTTNPGSVKIIKKGADGTFLNGAQFAIIKADAQGRPTGDVLASDTTENGGIAQFDGLAEGSYLVCETKSVDGYELYGEYKEVTVTAGAQTVVELEDPAAIELPRSGGIGVVVLIIAGAALIGLGIYLLKPTGKEKEDRE